MDAATVLRSARQRSGLSLRQLADLAGTSHSTLAAYEAGRKVPTVDTLERVLRATGQQREAGPQVTVYSGAQRAEELEQVLALAAQFPARHRRRLDAPVFGR